MKIFGILAIVLALFFLLICRPLAWYLILWRNRSLKTFTPPGTTFQPFKHDLFVVSALIFTFLYSAFALTFIVMRLDYQLFMLVLVNALKLESNIDFWEAAGVGAVLGIFISSVWGIFWSMRLLRLTRGQVDITLPPSQSPDGRNQVPSNSLPTLRSVK